MRFPADRCTLGGHDESIEFTADRCATPCNTLQPITMVISGGTDRCGAAVFWNRKGSRFCRYAVAWRARQASRKPLRITISRTKMPCSPQWPRKDSKSSHEPQKRAWRARGVATHGCVHQVWNMSPSL